MSFVGCLFHQCPLCLLWCHLTCFVSFSLSWLNKNFLFVSILSKLEILLLHSQHWRSRISRGILSLTALCSELLFNQEWGQVPLPDHRLLKCQGLWCMAECHLYREELSPPLPLHLHLVSVSYHTFSWPRFWLPEKRVMGIRENSCLASPWDLEGVYFQTPTQAVHRAPRTGLHSPPDPTCCSSAIWGASSLFSDVPGFGESLWVWRELRSPPETQGLQSQIYRLKPEGLAVTCSPLWSLSPQWGSPVLPAPNATLADVPSAGHSAISWLQSWRLHLQHHLLFLELFIAIMLVIHTSGAAVHCIQMSPNTHPGPDPNFSCLCKIFSSVLRPYLCSWWTLQPGRLLA